MRPSLAEQQGPRPPSLSGWTDRPQHPGSLTDGAGCCTNCRSWVLQGAPNSLPGVCPTAAAEEHSHPLVFHSQKTATGPPPVPNCSQKLGQGLTRCSPLLLSLRARLLHLSSCGGHTTEVPHARDTSPKSPTPFRLSAPEVSHYNPSSSFTQPHLSDHLRESKPTCLHQRGEMLLQQQTPHLHVPPHHCVQPSDWSMSCLPNSAFWRMGTAWRLLCLVL